MNRIAENWLWPLGVFVAGLILYTFTLAPGLLWGGGDFATFQTRAYLGDFLADPSIFGHGLWVLVAHPFTWLPINDPAWRANFAAAVFAAAALALVFLSARHITGSRAGSLLGVAALALSHTFWTYAVMPKVYSLNALLLALCVFLLLRWRAERKEWLLYLSAFVWGVSFFNHLVMGVAAAGFALFVLLTVWDQRRGWDRLQPLLLTPLSVLLGLSPYLLFLAQEGTASGTGSTVIGFLGGLGYAFTNPDALARAVGWGVLLGGYQFPLTGLLGLVGLWILWQRDRALFWLVAGGIGGTVAFLVAAVDPGPGTVYVWNLHYYLQAYVLLALALAVGYDWLWRRVRPSAGWRIGLVAVTLLLPPLLYASAPTVVRQVWRDVPDFRSLPGRDNFGYVLTPWKQNETGAREFGEAIVAHLPEDSVFFADYSIWAIVRYIQEVEGRRLDVELVNLTGANQVAEMLARNDGRPLLLGDVNHYYDMAGIETHFRVEARGPVYQLIPNEEDQ